MLDQVIKFLLDVLQHFDLHLVLVVEEVDRFVDLFDLPLDLHLLPKET